MKTKEQWMVFNQGVREFNPKTGIFNFEIKEENIKEISEEFIQHE